MSEIDSVLKETRSFPPPAAFQQRARLKSQAEYDALWRESIDAPEAFWGRMARELPWMQPFGQVLDWSNAPFARWFVGGKLNASAVCIDRHLAEHASKRAIVWEGEPGDTRVWNYADLHAEVCRLANALRARGVKKGDRVAIYMPMVPELAAALLACARIGAVHSVVFGGFSAQSLKDRIDDGGCVAVITADGSWRRGKLLPLKTVVDEALATCKGVHTSLVL
ncbi:MAG: acetyl-coenzyme A synthetase, partial [Planctomycetota bacterium]